MRFSTTLLLCFTILLTVLALLTDRTDALAIDKRLIKKKYNFRKPLDLDLNLKLGKDKKLKKSKSKSKKSPKKKGH
jgi:hypothetical protein